MADSQLPAPIDEIDPGRRASDSQSALAEKQPSTTTGRALLAASSPAAARGTLGVGTSDAPQFAGVNVGHASDTAITRISPGAIAVGGNPVAMGSGTVSGTNTGDQTISLTGDVTGSGTGTFAATIPSNTVTYGKMQDVSATDKLLGRASPGAGDVEEITCTAAGRAILDDASAVAQRNTLGCNTQAWPVLETDFATNSSVQGNAFAGTAISAGTVATTPANADVVKDHPGVVLVRSSTTNPSGYSFVTLAHAILLGGDEQWDCIFKTPGANLNSTNFRTGFLDSFTGVTADSVVDGAWMEFLAGGGGAVVGRTASNSSRSTTSTIATLSVSTWYHFRIVVNAAASTITFTVFNDSGVSLGSANLSANIPTASGRFTGAGTVVTGTTAAANDLVVLDYQRMSRNSQVSRGALT